MRQPHGDPLLTTRRVAQMCGTTEETVVYFAQTGLLRGHVVDGGWGVLQSDAQAFCEEWRGQKTRRWIPGTNGAPRPGPLRRAGGFALDTLNAVASVVSLATTVGLDGNRTLGFALAALNLLLVAVHVVWSAVQSRAQDAALAGGRVDPDAVAWQSGGCALSVLRGVQTACLVATVGFVAVSASPPSWRSIQGEQPAAVPVQSTATLITTDFAPTHQTSTQSVNFRTEPSTNAPVIAALPPATPLQYLDEEAPTSNPGEGDRWMLFRTEDGQEGWLLEINTEPYRP